MTELYVYYRLDPARAEAARVQVETAQAGLRREIVGLQTALLQRADAPAGAGAGGPDPAPATWMEIYRRPGGLDAPACAAIEAALRELPQARIGARVVERFTPMASLPSAADPLS